MQTASERLIRWHEARERLARIIQLHARTASKPLSVGVESALYDDLDKLYRQQGEG